jgi:hypothetical protein
MVFLWMEVEIEAVFKACSNPCRFPAFLVVFAFIGVLLFITASVGVLSTDLASCGVGVFCFGCYHALMIVLVALQLAALVLYYTYMVQYQRTDADSGEFLPAETDLWTTAQSDHSSVRPQCMYDRSSHPKIGMTFGLLH